MAAAVAAIVGVLPALAADEPAGETTPSARHEAWSRVLAARVEDGRVDYRRLATAREPFDAYLRQLELTTRSELDGMTKAERLAFWINAYNAYTIALVLDHYPLESIRDIVPLWKRAFQTVFTLRFIGLGHLAPSLESERLSLDDIEHRILRAKFDEPRIHFAVVCASKGCPKLRSEAYEGATVNDQLEQAVRAFLHEPSKNHYEERTHTLYVSPIFRWFAQDFETLGGPRGYFRRYGDAQIQHALAATGSEPTIGYTDYDWSLNEAKSGS